MSNPHCPDTEHDARVRLQLRQALDDTAPRGDQDALEERVMVQWQLRHDVRAQAVAMVGAGGPSLAGAHARPMKKGRLLALGLLLAAALALGWINQPDPVLEELMQPDVLSQIGLGEL